jgi:cyanophycinase-like exopeptidase
MPRGCSTSQTSISMAMGFKLHTTTSLVFKQLARRVFIGQGAVYINQIHQDFKLTIAREKITRQDMTVQRQKKYNM